MSPYALVKKYRNPSALRAWSQVAQTAVPFCALAWLMYWVQRLPYGWTLTLALSVPMAGLLVKWFTIQHDCGHGSFFRQRWLNDLVGGLLSPLVATPYRQWAAEHAKHHATSSNLDFRGVGDVDTWTIREYEAASRFWKLYYRLIRNPLFFFGFAAFLHFALLQRFPRYQLRKLETWKSVIVTNFGMLFLFAVFAIWIGVKPLLLIWLPTLYLAAIAGTWLFYVQHQFPGTHWARGNAWTHLEGALKGASYYDLPKVLHWFSGNIGFHHIHHLNSRIPNYNLPRCHAEHPELLGTEKLTLLSSLRCATLALWDEDREKLVSFSEALT